MLIKLGLPAPKKRTNGAQIMFIEVVYEESKNHPYGDPDIEVAKVALRTFIKHHPSEVQARIQIAEHEFRFRRVDEITKYDNETYSYKTFSASAWSVPDEGVEQACTTTYEFRTFVDEQAFVVSTSPSAEDIVTHVHGDADHSFRYWRPIEGQRVINELVRLLKQDDIITHLVLLAKTVPDAARCERAYLDGVVEQAECWLRCTSYDIPYIRISRQ
jgi:hypothetical protein